MSKKKFTDGLSDLFTPDTNAVSGKRTAFLRNPFEPSERKDDEIKAKRSSSNRKDFSTDLDSLFEEALQEVFEDQMAMAENDSSSKTKSFHQQTHRKRPLSGLDMLIRRTVESSPMEITHSANIKRLTVTFDKRKLEKLKKIARLEKAYLKDILGDIVADYIKEYEENKGKI